MTKRRWTEWSLAACTSLASTVAGGAGADYASQARHSNAVVLGTVEAVDDVLDPEALPAVPTRVRPDGTRATVFAADDGLRGVVARIRVTEILKANTLLALNSQADVYEPLAMVLAAWVPRVGAQYVFFLKLPVSRGSPAKAMRRWPPGTAGSGHLLLTEATYRLVGGRDGAVPVTHMRPETLASLRETVLAATRPQVTLTFPPAGASLAGQVVVAADARDDTGIVGVQFRVDGRDIGTEVRSRPFQLAWRSKSVPNGPHTVTAVARDGSGNRVEASAAIVTANTNAPPAVWADPTSATGGAQAFTWFWHDADADTLQCRFEVLQPQRCTFSGHCTQAGGSADGSIGCQARVNFGEPGGTACDYRLTCNDGWATSSGTFHLYFPE